MLKIYKKQNEEKINKTFETTSFKQEKRTQQRLDTCHANTKFQTFYHYMDKNM